MATWPTSLGNPNLPSVRGYSGFRDALKTYIDLAGGPLNRATGQLSGAVASDPSGTQYQQGTQELGGPNSGGRGEGAAAGLFGQLAAGQGGANAQGQVAQQAGAQAGLKGVATTDLDAATAVAQQEQARLAIENAQTRQTGNDLGLLQAGIGQLGPQGLFGTLANKGGGASANSPWANFGKLASGGLKSFGDWGAGSAVSGTTSSGVPFATDAASFDVPASGAAADSSGLFGSLSSGVSGIGSWLSSLFAAAPAAAAA